MSRAGWIRTVIVIGAIVTLELFCRFGFISRYYIISPSEMVVVLGQILISREQNHEILFSLVNIAIAVVLAIVGGIAIGLALHPMRRIRQIIAPLLSSYYALPIFAFYPVFIVIFGANRVPIITMGFLAGVVAMLLATLDGLDSVPHVLRKVARIHQLGPLTTGIRLTIPAAAPHILAGVKLTVAYAFIGVIGSEFILSPSGLGFAIGFAYNGFETPTMYGLILFIVLLVIFLNLIFRVLDARIQLRRRD
jgi:NitT/TauT family transport system permease protein